MSIEFYKETTPLPSVDYFSTWNEQGVRIAPSRIATVTVFYNEDGFTLEKTMRCLNAQQDIGQYGHDLLLVGDGLEQMSSSMSEYLQRVFNTDSLPTTIEHWPDWANTCVVKLGPNKDYWTHGRVCLVLKKYNKGKWNSHEWHMRSFANDSEFCFLTDVGCQYNTNLLQKFIKHIEDRENCVAVTGRRVAQTEFQQCDPTCHRQDSFMQSALRAFQSHMFENENNSKIENLIGCIPLLHGHCTFYNWSKVLKEPSFIDLYFRLAYKSPAEVGFLMAQLRLSEDSVQAMYLLTHIPNAETMVVEGALFYFDVELTWEKFTKQRRRWDNSNLAAAKYLLCGSSGHPHTIWGSSMPAWKKVAMSACMLRWMFTLLTMKFMISVYAMVLFKCSMVFCQVFTDKDMSLIICSSFLTLYFVVYIVFVAIHVKRFGANDRPFNAHVWMIACTLNICVQLITFSLIPIYFLVKLPEESVLVVQTMPLVGILANILPWVRTLYMDRKRAMNIFFNIPQFISIFLMGSMVYGFMPAYHLARAMDLSWGNRPGLDMQLYNAQEESSKRKCSVEKCPQSVSSDDASLCRDHSWMKSNVKKWKAINAAIVCLNIGLCALILCTKYAIVIITIVCLAANVHYALIVFVILFDILYGIRKLVIRASCACKSWYISKIEHTEKSDIDRIYIML